MSYSLEKILPPLPRTVRGKALVLNGDPKGENILYTSGNSVIIRNIHDFTKNDIYTQHAVAVNAAKYSPSGFYIASADSAGKVRIWDTVNAEHILKHEFQPFMGVLNDITWTSDNERILIGGNGSSKFAAVINAETGTSLGVMMGMSKSVNSVDFRPLRPYRAVTASDEGLVCFFDGPPFAFKSSSHSHKGFVNVVRYCPDGSFFVSGGADGKMFLYDGDTGEHVCEVGSPAHNGGVYGICFSPDGILCASVSADKSIKIWSIGSRTLSIHSVYNFPNSLDNMLLGCTWTGTKIAAVSLSGAIHLFNASSDISELGPPEVSLYGHRLHITCAFYSIEYSRLITASSDGCMASWDLDTGLAEMFSGAEMHTSQVQQMIGLDEHVFTVGMDDRCVLSSMRKRIYVSSVKLPSQPTSLCALAKTGNIIIACLEHVLLLHTKNETLSILDQIPLSLGLCTITTSDKFGLIVLTSQTQGLLCFVLSGDKLKRLNLVNAPSETLVVAAFSPDGNILATTKSDRSMNVFTVAYDGSQTDQPTLKSAVSDWWQRHTARVTCIGWSPNGRRVASGSIDNSIAVWSLDSPKKVIHILAAHPMSNSTALCWINDNKLLSTAHDGSIRVWNIE